MDASLINALIAGSVGLVTGAIGSLIAPWIQWGVEKKRKKHDRRVELISQWRQILMSPEFSREAIINHPLYGPLRDRLNEKIRREIERPANHFVVTLYSPINSRDRNLVLQEVARIEKEWDLI